MIKYANVPGYKNLGELGMFSHIYQMVELGHENKEMPVIILIHAYECDAKIFKGYGSNKTKTFKSITLTEDEKSEIENYIGASKQVGFKDFIAGTILEGQYRDFKDTEINDAD